MLLTVQIGGGSRGKTKRSEGVLKMERMEEIKTEALNIREK